MIRFNKVSLLIAVLVTALLILIFINVSTSINRATFQMVSEDQPYGFEPVNCWFDIKFGGTRTECYYMHVPEDHTKQAKDTNVVVFPVVVFRSNAKYNTKAPVLHLGAGGPGVPMWLNSSDNVEYILKGHDDISIKQGRDLFVIDPRGTGLSKPLLVCDKFVENEEVRLNQNLSFSEYSSSSEKDYRDCIKKFMDQGVDLSNYNSLSIANDVEMMRIASKVEKWTLVGVSYSTIYAQTTASQYPDSIESMILDSATFPNLKLHDNFLQKTMARYEALYNYCHLLANCNSSIENVEQRIWNLYEELNNKPIKLELNHPYENKKIKILLNGERFIFSLLNGVYSTYIFNDLPNIIIELEARRVMTIIPYISNAAAFLLDASYGDISVLSHYCYEDEKYIDFALIRKEAMKLPKGYIRNYALDFPNYCDQMRIESGASVIAAPIKTDIPTLFLHGKLDTVTPVSDVKQQRKLFSHSYLITFDVSHDVLGSEECSEVVAAKFIKNTSIHQGNLNCS